MKNKLLYRKRLSQFAYSLCLMVLCSTASWGQLLTVTNAGSGSYTVPAGVTSIKISTWGGGGAGGAANNAGSLSARAGGGAGGSFAVKTITVAENDVITYTVGAGGTSLLIGFTDLNYSNPGGATSATLNAAPTPFVNALGGPGGQCLNTSGNGIGGTATTSGNTGDTFYYGGNGGTALSTGQTGSGAGGGSAGSGGNGTAGVTLAAIGIGGLGLIAPAGNGGQGLNATTGAPTVGINPGGGGGGATKRAASTGYLAGAIGGNGMLIIENAASPVIAASTSALSGFVATVATASTSQSFTVSGTSLTNNLIVSTVSADYELSLDDFTTAGVISIDLGAGPTVASTPIYVRLKSGFVAGAKSANITVVSTGATSPLPVVCTGGVSATYYYKGDTGTGSLSLNTNWGTNPDGTGTNPSMSLGDAYATFVIRNTTAVSTDAVWTLEANSKIVVGDAGQPAVALTIAPTFQITGGTIDIPAASSGANKVFCQATPLPTSFGTLDANSEVHLQAPALATAAYYFGSTTYGKLFIDGAGVISNSIATFTSTIQTSLYVAPTSTLSFSSSTTAFIYVNPGASVTIDGTFRSGKTGGLFSVVPSLSVSSSVGNFQLNTTATLTLGSASTIEYNRGIVTNVQPISLPAGVIFNNLTIAANTGATVVGPISVAGKLTLSAGAILNIVAIGPVTLKSTATKTAVVAPLGALATIPVGPTVTLPGSATLIPTTGTFIVERYIPAGHRAYRLLSPATTGGTINANWQEGGLVSAVGDVSDPNPTYGTHLTALGGSANGFDTTTNNQASIFTYDNAAPIPAWAALANTSGTLSAGSPYLVYVRGSRVATNISGSLTNDATTLRTTGTLTTATVPVSGLNATANGFSIVGNPYQAQVDMKKVLVDNATSVNLAPFYYVVDPKLGTKGAYATVDLVTPANGTAVDANQYLQPGQACFVQTVAAGSASLNFTEADKYEGTQTSVFRTKNTVTSRLLLTLTDASANALDRLVVAFDANESNDVNQNDAFKLTNFDENMATSNSGKLLSIDKRATPTATDEIPLNFTKYRGTSYLLKVQGSGLTETPYLVDAFANKTTEIPQNGTVDYAYTVDAGNTASIAANRFKLIYAKTLKTIDNASEGFALYPNPSKSNSFNVVVPQSMAIASLTVSNLLGQQLYSQSDLQAGASASVTVSNVKTSGVYLVRLSSEGKTSTTKWIVE